MGQRERMQEIKTLLLELKTHLKATPGDVRQAAAAYFAPPKPKRKKTTRKKARSG